MMRRLAFAVIVVLACAGAAYAYGRMHRPAPAPLSASGAVQTAYWAKRIAAVGGVGAYKEFADAVATLPPSKQHEDAHAFGGALFTVLGVSGLSVCDAQFSYGCYHQFLGSAIASMGLQVVTELNQGCVNALKGSALSCQHGIGHGIEAYLGYDYAALTKSLAMCKDLPYNDPIGGCYGGVFMEYNMRTMLGDDAQIRPVAHDDQLYPCDTLSSPYRIACVFWSPQWWIQLQHTAKGKDFIDMAAVGKLCDTSGGDELIRACYEGLGTVVPPNADFDPAKTAQLCDDATSDPARALYCKSYAANALSGGGAGKVADGTKVCDGLSGAYRDYCMAYARNEANLASQLPDVQ